MIKVSWGAKQLAIPLEAAAAAAVEEEEEEEEEDEDEDEDEEEEEEEERRLEGLQVPVRLMHQHADTKKKRLPICGGQQCQSSHGHDTRHPPVRA